jgi:hypothetical protein
MNLSNLIQGFTGMMNNMEKNINNTGDKIRDDLVFLVLYSYKYSIANYSTYQAIKDLITNVDTITKESHQLNNFLSETIHSLRHNSHEITQEPNFMIVNKVGKYSIRERRSKILKMKLKLFKSRLKRPILKTFVGRSISAKNKPRCRGRFIKKKIFNVKKDIQKIENNICYENEHNVKKNFMNEHL